jgi:kyphoscoliosis peptidase
MSVPMRGVGRLAALAALGWWAAAPAGAAGAAESTAPRYDAMDRHALAAPADGTLPALVAALTRPARSDEEKARALFRWITAHIAYDAPRYFSGGFRNARATAADVLRTRKAVCDGYATLFLAMAAEAGLEARTVSGWGRGFAYRLGQAPDGPADHAWNAVRIAGQWRLLDATWGAGYLDAADRRFHRAFEGFYFFPPPQQFLNTHLPEDAQWQLVPAPLQRRAFAAQALLRPAFFRYGLSAQGHERALLEAAERLTLRLGVPPHVRLLAELRQDGRALGEHLVSVQPATGEVQAVFPGAGRYTLRIYARGAAEQSDFAWAADYLVQARRGSDFRFPAIGPAFHALGLATESHASGLIEAAGRVTVRLRAPQDVLLLAALKQGGRALPKSAAFVQRDGAAVQVHVALPGPGRYTLRLFAKRAGAAGDYDWALDYQLRSSTGSHDSFPTAFSAFGERGAVLAEPLQGELKAGSTVRFRLRVPGAEAVAVYSGSAVYPLERQGDAFQGSATVHAGRTGVYARFPGGKAFEGLLAYRVR